jgi:hypothetical protein
MLAVPWLVLVASLVLLGVVLGLVYALVRLAAGDGGRDALVGLEPQRVRAFHGLGPERSPHCRP